MRGEKALFSSDSDEWETPWEIVRTIEWRLGIDGFDLDPCATAKSAKAGRYYSVREDGLKQEWSGHVFVNPPFSAVTAWVKKAVAERERGDCPSIVLLLPARTDTQWFKVLWEVAPEIWFVTGRIRFQGADSSAPFPSMVVILRAGVVSTRAPNVVLMTFKEESDDCGHPRCRKGRRLDRPASAAAFAGRLRQRDHSGRYVEGRPRADCALGACGPDQAAR